MDLLLSLMKFGLEKTKILFLYEAVVYDKEKKHSFTDTNMVSESHHIIAVPIKLVGQLDR